MRLFTVAVLFILIDTICYFNVPKEIRHENTWAILPGGGAVLLLKELVK